jgi:hypothetical protein
VAGCCECGDEPSGSCATELVIYIYINLNPYFIQPSEPIGGGGIDPLIYEIIDNMEIAGGWSTHTLSKCCYYVCGLLQPLREVFCGSLYSV